MDFCNRFNATPVLKKVKPGGSAEPLANTIVHT